MLLAMLICKYFIIFSISDIWKSSSSNWCINGEPDTRHSIYVGSKHIYSQFYSPIEYERGNIEIVRKKTTKSLNYFMFHLSICHFSGTTAPLYNFLCPRALWIVFTGWKKSSFHEVFAIIEMVFTSFPDFPRQ